MRSARVRPCLALVAGAATLAATLALSPAPLVSTTAASWADVEASRAALAAGVVNPTPVVRCDRVNATQPRLFMTWDEPAAGGLPGVQYAWRLASAGSGALSGNGTVPIDGTRRVDLYPQAVGAPGSAVFYVRVVTASGWSSTETGFQVQYSGPAGGPWTATCVQRV